MFRGLTAYGSHFEFEPKCISRNDNEEFPCYVHVSEFGPRLTHAGFVPTYSLDRLDKSVFPLHNFHDVIFQLMYIRIRYVLIRYYRDLLSIIISTEISTMCINMLEVCKIIFS